MPITDKKDKKKKRPSEKDVRRMGEICQELMGMEHQMIMAGFASVIIRKDMLKEAPIMASIVSLTFACTKCLEDHEQQGFILDAMKAFKDDLLPRVKEKS